MYASPFLLPASLEANVEFWEKIYSKYDINQVVFHDRKDLSLVYGVLDLPKLENELSAVKYKDRVAEEQRRLRAVIAEVTADKPVITSPLHQSIYRELFKRGMAKDRDLAERVRSQSGLKSQFEAGLKTSGRYADEMKSILKSFDLPTELIAIVFVESLFGLGAESHAGASGPWGFIKPAAIQHGLAVNLLVDERKDPVLSTLGAARYLKNAKAQLGEWPLAITSYNYGVPGMIRATQNLSTKNLEVVIAKHQSPIFGFACKNYYAEFLAALRVYENHEKYFPNLNKERPWEYEVVELLRPLDSKDLLAYNVLEKTQLCELNPGLSRHTTGGAGVFPTSYALRIPKGSTDAFHQKLKAVPAKNRESAANKISLKYQASGRETVYTIAQKNGIDHDFLSARLNKPLSYKPAGTINIRAGAYLFSSIKKVFDGMLARSIPPKVATTATP